MRCRICDTLTPNEELCETCWELSEDGNPTHMVEKDRLPFDPDAPTFVDELLDVPVEEE